MMKLLVEYSSKSHINYDVDGIILPLDNYSVESITSFSLKEISDIRKKFDGEIFVKINKNLMNDDIEPISKILKKLDSIGITGIFFYHFKDHLIPVNFFISLTTTFRLQRHSNSSSLLLAHFWRWRPNLLVKKRLEITYLKILHY